jgi:hypothetical protein
MNLDGFPAFGLDYPFINKELHIDVIGAGDSWIAPTAGD